jgi:hypothetical protein
MVRFFKTGRQKKRFVEINLVPKKKSFLFILIEGFKHTDKVILGLISLSIIGFISIFIESYMANLLLNRKKLQINLLKRKIISATAQIHFLKKQIIVAEEKFKDFYIPYLKEKVFYIWYYKYGQKNIWNYINKFLQISKGWNVFQGFKVYPNPFNDLSKYTFFNKKESKGVLYQKLQNNIFIKPSGKYGLDNTYLIIVYPIVKDKKVKRILNRIRDKTIKANLLLQYSLLSHDINSLNFGVPQTILFPINTVCTNDLECNNVLSQLKRFCSRIYINKEFRKEKYFLNKIQPESVLEGICIKYTY